MALPAPNLDDRKFQDLVREARAMIPRYCPEWTDHNLSDPGITLIELFAWMVDILLYRLNRVPDKNYIKFMELIGVQLQPPQPAKVNVTFHLSAPQPEPIVIPKGTEIATVRTETRDAITFTTDRDLIITPPVLSHALTSADGTVFEDCLGTLRNPDRSVTIFQDPPKIGNALYLGFEGNLATQILALDIQSNIEGIGVDPNNPPLAWEYWDDENQRWSFMRVESDTTGGLNTKGRVVLHVPFTCGKREINGEKACWIRCRATLPAEGQRGYTKSPDVSSIKATCIGGTIPATHATRIRGESLGRSNGKPGQRFFVQNTPMLPLEEGETIEVETDTPNVFEPWEEVTHFAESGPNDKHFTCDSVTGEIQFGVSIRQPGGDERQYGMIPPTGRQIRLTSYRFGGGTIGNVGPETITVLKSSIPYVAAVINLEAARGGTEAESIEHAKMRAPQILKSRTRAVTAEDFEYLALESSPLVARAKCLTAGTNLQGEILPAGMVRLLVIPKVPQIEEPIPPEDLELTAPLVREVQRYLDERKLLGTRLEIAEPHYVPITIEARIKGKPGTDFAEVASEIEKALYRFVHPTVGGNDGNGWPFGRGITLPEVYAAIQRIGNIDFIREARLFLIDSQTGEREEAPSEMVIGANAIICSYQHEVIVEE